MRQMHINKHKERPLLHVTTEARILARCFCFVAFRRIYMYHRPLKIRTDDSQSRVRELGSIGIFVFLL